MSSDRFRSLTSEFRNRDSVQDEMDALLPQMGAPGATACIVKEGEVVWCGGFGFANIEDGVAATPHTPFMIASISKVITTATILSEVERGTISLDDNVADAMSFSIDAPNTVGLTWRALLTHTSGIKDNWTEMDAFYSWAGADGAQVPSTISLREAVTGYFGTGGAYFDAGNFQTFGPGGGWDYSNMGFSLAGAAIEEVTGQPFATLAQTNVFTPLGLNRTSFDWAALNDIDVAMPYGPNNVPYGHYAFSGTPDGGLRTSAFDLARIMAMLIRGGEYGGTRVLQSDTVAGMVSAQVPTHDPNQGLCVFSGDWGGDTWWGHSGAESGVTTSMYWRQSDGLGYVLLRNGDDNESPAGIEAEDALVAFGETL